jgi:general secretion pathway protein A
MAGYVGHFGLKAAPFDTAPNPAFAYATREHEIAMLRIQDSVEQRLGLCLLKGEVGMGKSTIANLLYQDWAEKPEEFLVAYISDPSAYTPSQFYRMLLNAYGLDVSRFLEINKNTLRNFLLDNFEQNRIVVALIDEAQTISAPNMATLHHLSNEQTPTTKLIQIALLAQPNFDRKLTYQPALNSRIARRGNLDPLILTDAVDMMRHRVTVAGGDFDALFPLPTHRPIYNATAGIPRKICVLCDNALFNAYARGEKSVTEASVERAVKDTEMVGKKDK